MKDVFVISDNIITSLGFTTSETFSQIKKNHSGLRICADKSLTPTPLPLSQVENDLLEQKFTSRVQISRPDLLDHPFTRLEKLFILSIGDAIDKTGINFTGKETLLILSTTKGNIDLLDKSKSDKFPSDRVFLWKMAAVINDFFRFASKPVIVSNACISGVLALGLASRYIRSGNFENVIVSGGDLLTEFVISGFQSFQALSPEPCRPFDANRTGLSLGEGCGTMVLSSHKPDGISVTITGAATTNDANHISGPSRTGEELATAIGHAIEESGIKASDIGYISAHGTATAYNDEMESKAITLAGMMNAPVNSFKGYWGHTLGAAGVIESIMAVQSMKESILLKSAGYEVPGVSEPIRIIAENKRAVLNNVLKIASGFGGCNAALIFHKD